MSENAGRLWFNPLSVAELVSLGPRRMMALS
jgi:hypothetical protein